MAGVNVISSHAVSYSDATIDQIKLTLHSITLATKFEIYEASCPIASTFNPLTPELNPAAQRCLKRTFTGDFAS
jgi:hypothetical protein